VPNTRLYHTLFGIALVTMVALGVWWFILHSRRVDEIHQGRVKTLTLQAHLFSIQMGRYPKSEPPPLFADDSPFEVAPVEQLQEEEIGFPMRPNWPHLVVRARPDALKSLEEAHLRQRIMVTGEGTLLVLLILVCIFMLYRLLLTERQTRKTMETFFHAVSHELKTPVAGIKALLETLASRHFNEDGEPLKKPIFFLGKRTQWEMGFSRS
jgi:signal transduction histidine kinase